ncbi:hypothetical protein BUALT_Bualt05G0047400 [Buddleja alternifolia]|uniref:Transposase (putative) gypsy type domain-containing protein n=1 Tax=Buddleja alternifolia TaxID=168488 RepID=A0AAV6XQ66_9LAMI|nr:hypothetical protein BUALT_Bualt05G0047400 [Buddleja alternifolia]
MSSVISTINPSLTISELIKAIKYSFRECEFDEVRIILMDREKNMKIEMKNLERDRDSIKEELRLLERSRKLAELENTKLVVKLQSSQRKSEELEQTIIDSSDREKKAKERYDKIILDLNEKINELKNKNSENERLVVGVYQEKFQCLDENEKLKKELDELKKEKEKIVGCNNALAQDHKKLDGQLIKALSQAIDQARMEGYTQAHQQVYENFPKTEENADKNADELRFETLKSDEAAEVNEKRSEIMKQSGSKGLKGSGPHATDRALIEEQLMFEAEYSGKTPPSSSPAGDIIEISDSDDETAPGGAAYISNIGANVGENETMLGKISSAQTTKRNRREDSPVRSTPKRKRIICESDDDSLPIDKKENEVLESDPKDESCSVSGNSNPPIPEPSSPETNIKQMAKLPYYHNYQSQITSNHVKQLRKFAGIPPEYKIVIPSPEDRPNNPPPGFLCFLTHQLNGGLRFPIAPLFSDIACLFKISLSQLTPNSFRLMTGFAMAVRYLGEEPTASLFQSYFHLNRKDGLFYFTSRSDVRFLKGYPSSIPGWKNQYFFISSPKPWNFPTVWRNSLPNAEKNVIHRRDHDCKSLLDRLNQNPYNLSRLVEPGLLYHFGLSPLRKRLLEPLEEIMVKNLMKEEAVNSPKRRQVGKQLRHVFSKSAGRARLSSWGFDIAFCYWELKRGVGDALAEFVVDHLLLSDVHDQQPVFLLPFFK